MRITTRVTYASIDDFLNNAPPISWKGFEYSGPVAFCKKGRGSLDAAEKAGTTNTTTAQGVEGQDQNLVNSQTNLSGGLSPLVSKQLASEKGNIQQAYTGATQAASRGLAQRGMGVAPSGLSASITNTGINNEGKAETGATGEAFGVQNDLNNKAPGILQSGLSGVNQSIGATTDAASARSKAGSTLGDIGTGIGTLASAAGSVAGLGGFKGIGNSVMNGNS